VLPLYGMHIACMLFSDHYTHALWGLLSITVFVDAADDALTGGTSRQTEC